MLVWIVNAYRQWRLYRQTVDELGRLDDRMLSDLNITRGEISYVARKAVRGA